MENLLGQEAIGDNGAPCLLPGPGDTGLPDGTTHTPEPDGPTFIKRFDKTLNRSVWRVHVPAKK